MVHMLTIPALMKLRQKDWVWGQPCVHSELHSSLCESLSHKRKMILNLVVTAMLLMAKPFNLQYLCIQALFLENSWSVSLHLWLCCNGI
jgi:hypothetical protein